MSKTIKKQKSSPGNKGQGATGSGTSTFSVGNAIKKIGTKEKDKRLYKRLYYSYIEHYGLDYEPV